MSIYIKGITKTKNGERITSKKFRSIIVNCTDITESYLLLEKAGYEYNSNDTIFPFKTLVALEGFQV